MNARKSAFVLCLILILSLLFIPPGSTQAARSRPFEPSLPSNLGLPADGGSLYWNTFLGGDAFEAGYGIAVDRSGNIYITGYSSASWGTPVRAFEGGHDAFVAKLDRSGALVWNTFLGGSESDDGLTIAVDGSGNVYITGYSSASWGTPVRAFADGYDAFVAKLNRSGMLAWNTFLGGRGSDSGSGIALDGGGNIYITGISSAGWGRPVHAFAGFGDAFVARLNRSGGLAWNTFLGGSDRDRGMGITVDASGNVYISGDSHATWGTPKEPFTGVPGCADAFVAKLNSSGVLAWNSFLGSLFDDYGQAIAVDGNGNLFISGTSVTNLGDPISCWEGGSDAFVARFNPGGALAWNIFLNAGEQEKGQGDRGDGIAVDGNGNVYVSGSSTASWGTPVNAFTGGRDAFVAKFDRSGALTWNTFLGGGGGDVGLGIALDGSGNVYVSGGSNASWGTPVRAFAGFQDAFVAQLSSGNTTEIQRFLSAGAADGWLLESAETSSRGGSMNAGATTFVLGDDAQDRQYRAILSFNTSGLPDSAVITKATLKIKRQGIVGTNPFSTHMGLKVDIRMPYFGAAAGLAISDFQAGASKSAVATFNKTPAAGAWYSAVLSGTAYPYINLKGMTQFRLRFAKDDNDDLGADYLKFYSGNAGSAYRPVLVIEYSIP